MPIHRRYIRQMLINKYFLKQKNSPAIRKCVSLIPSQHLSPIAGTIFSHSCFAKVARAAVHSGKLKKTLEKSSGAPPFIDLTQVMELIYVKEL